MKKNNTFLLILFLFLFSVCSAQVTTVIPLESFSVENKPQNDESYLWVKGVDGDPSNGSYSNLTFNLSSLPEDAVITTCTLRLVVAKFDSRRIKVTVKEVNTGKQIASSRSLLKGDFPDNVYKEKEGVVLITSRNAAQFAQSLSDAKKNRSKLALKLMTTSGDRPAIAFCSGSKKTAVITQEGLIPRLIVTYSFKARPVEWAGLQADAQHTSRTNQRFYSSKPTEWSLTEIGNYNNIYYDPVVYKEQIYLSAGPASFAYIYAINPFDKSSRQNPKSGTNGLVLPAKMPVIDPLGKLYYSAKDNSVHCYDLEKKSPNTTFNLPHRLMASPTSGPDGRLYFSTENYIFAYAAYPLHMPIWRFSVGNAIPSSVALNKEGSIAYVVLEEGNSDRIVALNTTDGTEINQQKINITLAGSVPMPVIGGKGNVFVVDKFPTGNSIHVLNDQLEKIIYTIKGNDVSKPVVGLDRIVYYVKDSNLYKYSDKWETPLGGSSINLGRITSMVIDGSNNIYCLNKASKKISAFDSKGTSLGSLIHANIAKIKEDLLVTNDGSIYAVGSNSLFAIRPINFNPSINTFPDKEFKFFTDNATFRAKELIVGSGTGAQFKYPRGYRHTVIGANTVSVGPNVSLEESSNLTIISGSKISFKPGFSVKSGAKLTCKTGY